MIQIYKASAGSGKTFTLAREYIKLLLQDRNVEDGHAYRHILAVTFTNKATSEMKSRIIKELDILSRCPGQSPYLKDLLQSTDLETPEAVSRECRKALSDILGDYSAFSVSTIDKFFQRVLRAFSKEIGQFAQYQVELDRSMLVQETVDRILDSLGEDQSGLLRWLSNSSIDAIEAGDGYHLERNLKEFADGFMSEGYRRKLENQKIDRKKAFSEDGISQFKSVCSDVRKKFDHGFAAAVSRLQGVAGNISCLQSNFSKVLAKFSGYKSGDEIDFASKTWNSALSDIDKAFKKSDKSFKFVGDGIKQDLLSACLDVQSFAATYPTMRTAVMLGRQVSVFRAAESLDRSFEALLKEKNVLSLDDTNTILRDIISNDNAPFVYEKVGTRYRHFLLDEFQDTSLTQWENFRPLLQESLAQNCYNLIVGDVKQSIYRWRNADWNILDSKVESELESVSVKTMQDNWRSAPKIVEFNNSFYAYLAQRLDVQLSSKLSGSAAGARDGKSIAEIYSDVSQAPHDKVGTDGYVEATVCDPSLIISYAVEAVQRGKTHGFDWKDIAVIVRTNDIGGAVAAALVAAGIPVVTNDSLRISSGLTVRRLVSCLFRADNPSDLIGGYGAGDFDPASLDSCQSLSDMAETILRSFDRAEVNADTLYVLAFMDLLRDYVARNGNSLHSFLTYWKEEGALKNITSPEGNDAVSIITIHKVKGLDYPYVVIPFPKKDDFLKTTSKYWECPELRGTALEKAPKALYYTSLSSKSCDTLFAENYFNELRFSYIDAANVWYVATTRASQSMFLVAPATSGNEVKQVSDALCDFVRGNGFVSLDVEEPLDDKPVQRYCFGTQQEKACGESVSPFPSENLSYFPDDVTDFAREQVRIKTDSEDFFADSRRLRGIVLHKILERVNRISDLPGSVEQACRDGLLDSACASEALSLLSDALESVEERGWFGDGVCALAEREVLSAQGAQRPDRVIRRADGVDIIDYKFGEPRSSYRRQIAGYVDLYSRMGYSNVRGFIWYVETGQIVEC